MKDLIEDRYTVAEPPREAGYYLYILECGDHTLYTGWTTCLAKRLAVHQSGRGAKYTRARLPVRLVYYETCSSEHEARSREYYVKKMSREEKLALVRSRGNNGSQCASPDKKTNRDTARLSLPVSGLVGGMKLRS